MLLDKRQEISSVLCPGMRPKSWGHSSTCKGETTGLPSMLGWRESSGLEHILCIWEPTFNPHTTRSPQHHKCSECGPKTRKQKATDFFFLPFDVIIRISHICIMQSTRSWLCCIIDHTLQIILRSHLAYGRWDTRIKFIASCLQGKYCTNEPSLGPSLRTIQCPKLNC